MNAFIKNIIIIAVGAIVCLALALFVVRPMLENTSELKNQLDEKKQEVAGLEQQIHAYQTAKSDLARATDKEKISKAFLAKEDLVTAIQGIEGDVAATQSTEDLSITDPFLIKREAGTPAPQPLVRGLTGITEVPYRITGIGTYNGITDLFSYLEHLPNFTEISKFQLSAETATSGGPKAAHTGKTMISIDGVFFVKNNEPTQH